MEQPEMELRQVAKKQAPQTDDPECETNGAGDPTEPLTVEFRTPQNGDPENAANTADDPEESTAVNSGTTQSGPGSKKCWETLNLVFCFFLVGADTFMPLKNVITGHCNTNWDLYCCVIAIALGAVQLLVFIAEGLLKIPKVRNLNCWEKSKRSKKARETLEKGAIRKLVELLVVQTAEEIPQAIDRIRSLFSHVKDRSGGSIKLALLAAVARLATIEGKGDGRKEKVLTAIVVVEMVIMGVLGIISAIKDSY